MNFILIAITPKEEKHVIENPFIYIIIEKYVSPKNVLLPKVKQNEGALNLPPFFCTPLAGACPLKIHFLMLFF